MGISHAPPAADHRGSHRNFSERLAARILGGNASARGMVFPKAARGARSRSYRRSGGRRCTSGKQRSGAFVKGEYISTLPARPVDVEKKQGVAGAALRG